MGISQAMLLNLEPQTVGEGGVQPIQQAVFELAVPPYSIPFTNIFPLDSSTLQLSIKDFFDQMDQLGKYLSESQIDSLYSIGILATAAMVAVEITRRQFRPAVLAPAASRRIIPYPYDP